MAANDDHIIDHIDGDDDNDSSTKKKLRHVLRHLPWRRVALITDVKPSAEHNIHRREVAYKWLQGSRVPFLLASAVTYLGWHNVILSTILFLISVPLPWIAVVIANGAGSPRDSRTPAMYKPAAARHYEQLQSFVHPQLTDGSHAEQPTDPPQATT
ncbi:hypothetical membrane protein [Corynebacterium kutscheri]|uniref:Hypothetical membrane protein n=1 Tax=Corynebacterium kutscheri TaxID=35755 RepID=A0A0F6QZW9_9CORY|nr:DUF3099 domain-containing protein [Corynebacterium kutscheri]AKE41377.1 Protein of unknown function (DUF3099) [Corynebacterium kutscheri]VEH08654.1 hypothetical membrane protein [Corynebacterium kutscheri]VEH09701.1 hypothetical membrane protein [Corynebacterium kutscheri]VEH79783.1 hypothetical membrane protein [Corynebacterium kutscheri]